MLPQEHIRVFGFQYKAFPQRFYELLGICCIKVDKDNEMHPLEILGILIVHRNFNYD